jgi:hypothetical protein
MSDIVSVVENMNRWELENRLLVQAISSSQEEARLASNPKEFIEAELGAVLPDGVTVQLIKEEKGHIKLIVPSPQNTFLGGLDLRVDLVGLSGRLTRKHQEAKIAIAAGFDAAAVRATALQALHEANPTLPADVTLEVIEEPQNTLLLVYPYVGRASYR